MIVSLFENPLLLGDRITIGAPCAALNTDILLFENVKLISLTTSSIVYFS